MKLHYLPTDLRKWTGSRRDALVVTFFADERPLRGAAGLADWRLCGRLSQLVQGERVQGKRGDSLMMPAGRRLPFERLFVFGLGRGGALDEATFRTHAQWIGDVLARAKVKQYALQPPGRATGLIAARRAAELWIEEAGAGCEDLTFIDSAGSHKEMGDILARS